jgi:esterase/lipase superfamily enzyme
MSERHIKWYTPYLNREFEMLAFGENIAFRHPDAVSHLISLSGSFDISSFFDGYHDDNIYFNSPYQYPPNTTDPWK